MHLIEHLLVLLLLPVSRLTVGTLTSASTAVTAVGRMLLPAVTCFLHLEAYQAGAVLASAPRVQPCLLAGCPNRLLKSISMIGSYSDSPGCSSGLVMHLTAVAYRRSF